MRPGSILLVVAVLALGTVALADGLRGDAHEGVKPQAAAGRTSFPPIIRGTLLYADEDCVVRAVSLPTRAPADAPGWRRCAFAVSPEGEKAARPGTGWGPDEATVATEHDGSVFVASKATSGFSFPGSRPAFRPDGLLSYVRHGEVLLVDLDCARGHPLRDFCRAVAFTRADIRSAAASHPNVPSGEFLLSAAVKELAWLDSTRAVAILSLRVRFVGDYELVAVFAGRHVARAIPFFGERLSRLQVSPFGSYFGARSHAGRIHLFDRDGARVSAPDLAEQRAFAFSPDERWTAIATRASVYVFRTGSENPRVHRIGISARDLAWRAL